MASFVTDTTQAPMLTFRVDGDPTYEQVLAHLQEYREFLARCQPYVVVFDVRDAGMGSAKVRKAYADFLNANAEDLRLFCKGIAFVVTSSIVQGAITAVLWLAPLPFPHKTFGNVEEARAWLRSRL